MRAGMAAEAAAVGLNRLTGGASRPVGRDAAAWLLNDKPSTAISAAPGESVSLSDSTTFLWRWRCTVDGAMSCSLSLSLSRHAGMITGRRNHGDADTAAAS